MKDNYGREINYLRISITDKCNLRCQYCMPEGVELMPMSCLLTFEEIRRVCVQASALGIRKIKITGGEPLVRRGAPVLISMLREIDGIDDVTLTTNGVLLKKLLPELIKSGLQSINVSLDTMDRRLYQKITGKDVFPQVIDGILSAIDAGFQVKLNTVLLKTYNEESWQSIVEFASLHPVDVRFIEIMPIGRGKTVEGVYKEELLKKIQKKYPLIQKDQNCHGNGPADYYKIPGFEGSVGFISAMHGKFCENCNRIRMNAKGELKSCLCYEPSEELRSILRNPRMDESEKDIEIKKRLEKVIDEKPQAHCFDQKDHITETENMISIGG